MRDHDIVVYGATGFAGALVAGHLAEHAPAGTRIALAGRNGDRLAAVRAKLAAGQATGAAWNNAAGQPGAAAPPEAGAARPEATAPPGAAAPPEAGARPAAPAAAAAAHPDAAGRTDVASWPIIVADAADTAALAELAASTKVVVSTVGPFAKYGHALVRACAEAGTDYADLTGEVLFVRQSIDDNHELAARTGARIVHSCGFDSIPSDIGVHVLHAAAREAGAGELTDTTLVVTKLSGGFSGGTIDTMRNQLDEVRADQAARRIAASPYSLTPDRAAEPDLGRQSDLVTVNASDVDPSLRGTLAPFFMASYNTRVVRRSNALRHYAYGRTFRYRETMSTGTSPLSPVIAAATKLGTGALFAGLAFPPTRAVLDRLLPKPGTGPSEQTRRNGHFTVDIFTTTTTGARIAARFKAQGDPGYAATAVMLGESALALAFDRDALPESPGGVLTPSTGIGDALVTRLRSAGVEISTRVVTSAVG